MSTTQSSASSESGLIDDDSLSSVNYISAKIQESSSPRLSFNPSVCQLLSRISFGTRRSFEEGLFSSSNMSSSTLDAERQILYNNAVPDPETEFNPYWGYVGGGFFFFTVLHYFTKFAVPLSADVTRQQRWKWRNVFTSFCHSTITGIWAPLTFYADPAMCDDMIYAFNHSTHILISFSIGYFIYDFIDMLLYNPKRTTYELLLHHTCVITCFGIAASTRMYLPYASLALVVEINSIFLHMRQLFIIQGKPAKNSMTYRNVALLNVATFVLFRILLLGWMTRWLTENRDNVPMIFFTAGSIGLATIISMNAILFYRILSKDFFCSSTSSPGFLQSENKNKLKCESNILNEPGFHPVTKDVNRIMKSLFDDEASSSSSANTSAEQNQQAKKNH